MVATSCGFYQTLRTNLRAGHGVSLLSAVLAVL